MFSGSDFPTRLDRDGFAIVEGILDQELADRLSEVLGELPDSDAVRGKDNAFAIRNLLEICPEVRELARSGAIRALATQVLGDSCFAVRATYFDKVPEANWKVSWHQDTAIVVRTRIEAPGYKAWSEKAGAIHVQPPEPILLGMLALRIHLDDCFSDNGPLRVLVGSHRQRWPLESLDLAKAHHPEVGCEVAKGGVLAMRPLLLHASGPSQSPHHRRVIHLEYAAANLPGGLEWKNRVR